MRREKILLTTTLLIFTLIAIRSFFVYKIYKNEQIQEGTPITTYNTACTNNSPTPTIYQKIEDGFKRVSTRNPLNITLDIPSEANYKILSDNNEDWNITIEYQNLTITYCTGCDWMGAECGGIDFDKCFSEKTSLSKSEITEYFLISNPNYLVRATSFFNLNNYRDYELNIKTNNHKGLTSEELNLTEKINSSIHEN